MKASLLDFRRRSKDILRALDRNEPVTLTFRGKPKAIIVPSGKPAGKAIVKAHPAFGIWKDRKDLADVRGKIAELRKIRHAV